MLKSRHDHLLARSTVAYAPLPSHSEAEDGQAFVLLGLSRAYGNTLYRGYVGIIFPYSLQEQVGAMPFPLNFWHPCRSIHYAWTCSLFARRSNLPQGSKLKGGFQVTMHNPINFWMIQGRVAVRWARCLTYPQQGCELDLKL